jgi:hypothetical protein
MVTRVSVCVAGHLDQSVALEFFDVIIHHGAAQMGGFSDPGLTDGRDFMDGEKDGKTAEVLGRQKVF